jgi:hypothetical protein
MAAVALWQMPAVALWQMPVTPTVALWQMPVTPTVALWQMPAVALWQMPALPSTPVGSISRVRASGSAVCFLMQIAVSPAPARTPRARAASRF